MPRDIRYLEDIAGRVRLDILEMVYREQSGHIGGAFSIVETLTALYFDVMNVDPASPGKPDRDRLVLSKGHTAPALYAVLAEAGFFPVETLFTSFRGLDSVLQGHPDMKKTPGVDMTSGSLGIGLSAANGMALAAKTLGAGFRVYCIMGDGEIDEGQIWEAAATARHFALDNVTAFVDVNGLQNDGPTCAVKNKGDIADKWRAFGWHVQEIDGHDFRQILSAVDTANAQAGLPSVIVQHTVKGKGVSFMEDVVVWHGKSPNEEEYRLALQQLSNDKSRTGVL